jgi:phosphoglycerate kinase
MKKSVRDVEVTGKRVLLRVDFNVPMQDDLILDDARIRAGLPTIRYLIEQRARVILISHLGRPNGFVVENLRMNPVAARLADLLRIPVMKVNNCIGPEVQDAIKAMEPGQVLFLENVRFHPGEVVNDQHFAAQLAANADVLVNDAFSLAHRIQASTVGITRYIPSVAGLLMENELKGLVNVQHSIRQPVVIVLGGVRLVDKGRFIDDSLEGMCKMLFGGVLANTFLKAKGLNTGQSRIETQALRLAREFLVSSHYHLELPIDLVVADELNEHARRRVVPTTHVPASGYIVDIGPGTIERYSQEFSGAGTVIWNGPMGVVGPPSFMKGTDAIARKIASLENAVKIAGGGDTLIAIERLGLTGQFNYLSTGGAAFLDALGKELLPAVKVLLDKEEQAVTGSPGNPNLPVG